MRLIWGLLWVLIAVSTAACHGRGRRGGDPDTPPADAAAPTDAGTGRDGAAPPDGGGDDAGPTETDAGHDASVPPSVDVSGSWSGTWSSSGLTDTATASFTQTGSTVDGALFLNGSPCASEGMVEATVMGSDLHGTFSSGADSASFTATATSTRIVGSFTVDSGGCAGIGGTIDLSR